MKSWSKSFYSRYSTEKKKVGTNQEFGTQINQNCLVLFFEFLLTRRRLT